MNSFSAQQGREHNILKQGMENYQVNKYKEIEKYYLSETIKLSLLTGPLYLISANMQFLQVGIINSSNLSFLQNNIPNYTLNLPFKPSIFSSIKENVFSLRRQGLLGFYKGNFYRLLFLTGTNRLKKYMDPIMNQYLKVNTKLKELILYSFADFLLNPLLFIESRYSIQNRNPGFRLYKNTFDLITKSWRELYTGAYYSVPRNIVFVLSLNIYFIYPSQYLQIFSVFLAHLLSYPILTLQRNKIYHSYYIDYLPKQNSTGLFSTQIIKDYGFLSLYRGFSTYILATLLWHMYVPTMAKAKFYKNALMDDKGDVMKLDFFEDDEGDD
jgi:hypothetical protein